MENKQKSLDSNKQFINNKSDSELNNLMVEFDNYESEEPEKDIIMELKKDPTLKEFDDKVTENISALKQKQETLEEVAKKSAIENFEKGNSYYILGFENGAKWQQEQDKKMYSEEDLIDAFNEGQALNVRGKLIQGKEWFKQLKDK